jgi:diguanylate cyclase (GGDEF)-like protein
MTITTENRYLNELNALRQRIMVLETEVNNRQLNELHLKMLVDSLITKQNDLEILVETLIEHGDLVDALWWKQLCDAEQLAEQDPLTGLVNRRGLDHYLDKQWLLHANLHQPLAVLVCDVDYFKNYNDIFGHFAGDACLLKIANVLKRQVYRETDLAARFGGEEFVVVLANTSLKAAVGCATRILEKLAEEKILHQMPKENCSVTLSIGVVSKIPDATESFHAMLEEADRFLYQAKAQGRNQVCYDKAALI